MEPLHAPTRPWRGWRNTDTWGSGAFLASRDNGNRPHLGSDLIVVPGDAIVSPIDGKVTHLGFAYAGDPYLRSVRILGSGKHAGVEVRLLYVDPSVSEGQIVLADSSIGVAQKVSSRYPGITEHVHMEVWLASNPADLLPRYVPHGEAT